MEEGRGGISHGFGVGNGDEKRGNIICKGVPGGKDFGGALYSRGVGGEYRGFWGEYRGFGGEYRGFGGEYWGVAGEYWGVGREKRVVGGGNSTLGCNDLDNVGKDNDIRGLHCLINGVNF